MGFYHVSDELPFVREALLQEALTSFSLCMFTTLPSNNLSFQEAKLHEGAQLCVFVNLFMICVRVYVERLKSRI